MSFITHAQLRAFHAVARAGGFTAAARRLKLTQPAVTQQVRALEEAHGVDLFHRRGRQVELTDTGAALHAITRRIFELEDEAAHLLASVGGMQRGRLRVGADGPYHVIGIIAAFRRRFPGVQISVTIGNSQAMRESLLDYRADVAVLAEDDGDERFLAVAYGRHPVVVFVDRDHPWAGRRSIRLAELDGQPMVRREEGSSTQRAFDRALAAAGVRPDFVMEIGSREAVHEAVAAGLGCGVVLAAELGRDDRLRAIAIADADIATREYVVCLRERRDARAVAAFLALAAEAAQAPEGWRGAALDRASAGR